MSLVNNDKITKTTKIPDSQLRAIEVFLQGAVYCWIKNYKDKKFAAKDLIGKEIYDWENTPLRYIREKHKKLKTDEKSISLAAGQDLGRILINTLNKDNYWFESFEGRPKTYKWVK